MGLDPLLTVHFGVENDGESTGEAAKIFKSPWFWVGVGVVVAVVGGLVIGTQVGD